MEVHVHIGNAFLVAALLIGGFDRGLAQAPRNFGGVWKTPSDVVGGRPVAEPGRTGMGAKGKSTLMIEQSGDSLIITGGTVRTAYALDGSRTENYVKESERHTPMHSRAHWEGKELVLVDSYELSDGLKMLVTRRLDLDADGNLQWRQRMVSNAGIYNLSTTYVKQQPLVP